MNKYLRRFTSILWLALTVAACAAPMNAGDPQSSSVNEVETAVAMTLQAMAPDSTETSADAPESASTLLPHSLYFLSNMQVFRLERDGKTQVQLTSEPAGVDAYDVSSVDGAVAYITNNQLILIDADGSNRRELVLGGPKEGNNPWITNPVFSPDGKIIAYGHDGLYFLELETMTGDQVLDNQYGEPSPDGFRFPLELYWPEQFSPDGKKLLVSMGHWEVAPSHAVYDLETKTLVRAEGGGSDGSYCCSFHGGPVWSPDSSTYYGLASIHDTAYKYGELWKVDAATGAVTRMFDSPFAGSETVFLPVEVHAASDGQLYFFFGAYSVDSGYYYPPVLQLARFNAEPGAQPAVLREDNFRSMQEALWAPDGSFVIVASAPERFWDQPGGVLELYPVDAQKENVWLAPIGAQMKWGP
jgi:hypothetical protein